jgi:hypothetical protein
VSCSLKLYCIICRTVGTWETNPLCPMTARCRSHLAADPYRASSSPEPRTSTRGRHPKHLAELLAHSAFSQDGGETNGETLLLNESPPSRHHGRPGRREDPSLPGVVRRWHDSQSPDARRDAKSFGRPSSLRQMPRTPARPPDTHCRPTNTNELRACC